MSNASAKYILSAEDRTQSAVRSVRAGFESIDKSAKELSAGFKGFGKLLGVGGVVGLGMKAMGIATREMEAALNAASASSSEFRKAMEAIEDASQKAAAPGNLPELTKQAEKLRAKIASPEYVAAASAWSQYWADRALFVKNEFADLGRMVGKVGDALGAFDVAAVERAQRFGAADPRGTGTKRGTRDSVHGGRGQLEDWEKIQKKLADDAKQAAGDARIAFDDYVKGLQRAADGQQRWADMVTSTNQSVRDSFADMGEAIDRDLAGYADAGIGNMGDLLAEAERAFADMSVYADQAARNMQDAFADFLFDPFEGGVKGMLKSFIDAMRRMVAEQAAAALFDSIGGGLGGILAGLFGGARAKGGPVSAGKSYLVGEQGPELFTPGASGAITPRAAGGAITIQQHFDNRGATVEAIQLLPAVAKQASDDAVQRILKMRRQGRL